RCARAHAIGRARVGTRFYAHGSARADAHARADAVAGYRGGAAASRAGAVPGDPRRGRARAAAAARPRARPARAAVLPPDERLPRYPVFQSAPLNVGATYTSPVFTVAGTYNYICGIHGAMMSGTVTVQAGGPSTAPVNIVDFAFNPAN